MTEETIRSLLQLTARLASVVFVLAFTAEALFSLRPAPATLWLKERKRGLMLGFVFAHTIHLGLIGALAVTKSGRFVAETGMWTLVLGSVVYTVIAGLAVSALRTVPWTRFEVVGSWIVGLTLARPLLMKAFALKAPIYFPLALMFVAAFAIRVVGRPRTGLVGESCRSP